MHHLGVPPGRSPSGTTSTARSWCRATERLVPGSGAERRPCPRALSAPPSHERPTGPPEGHSCAYWPFCAFPWPLRGAKSPTPTGAEPCPTSQSEPKMGLSKGGISEFILETTDRITAGQRRFSPVAQRPPRGKSSGTGRTRAATPARSRARPGSRCHGPRRPGRRRRRRPSEDADRRSARRRPSWRPPAAGRVRRGRRRRGRTDAHG